MLRRSLEFTPRRYWPCSQPSPPRSKFSAGRGSVRGSAFSPSSVCAGPLQFQEDPTKLRRHQFDHEKPRARNPWFSPLRSQQTSRRRARQVFTAIRGSPGTHACYDCLCNRSVEHYACACRQLVRGNPERLSRIRELLRRTHRLGNHSHSRSNFRNTLCRLTF